jgi:hypothetical protein
LLLAVAAALVVEEADDEVELGWLLLEHPGAATAITKTAPASSDKR